MRPGIAIASAATAAAVSAAVLVAADGSGSGRRPAAEPGRSLTVPALGRSPRGCPVTNPGWRRPPGGKEGRLWVAFGPTGGIYRVPRFNVGPDGSLGVKIAWQRGPGVRGRVRVEAQRLDRYAPPVRRVISAGGYGLTGIQASGIAFPSAGCWRVTASAGGARVTFVLLVVGPGATRPSPPRRAVVGCARRSMAEFPGAFTRPRNLVVGPLALVGAGEPTPASVVREFGGNKFPALVKAGHTVTVRLPLGVRTVAGLAYGGMGDGPLPQGETRHRDTAHTMTFVACRPDQPSGSSADGEAVTFWSGFVVLRAPACVPLEVYVDHEPRPRRAMLDMGGRRCDG
jgi:hypothetical protein